MSNRKITPGRGIQYTPKTSIKWANEFNELADSFKSRNELISALIEDGLKVRNGSYKEQGIYLPLDTFANDQLAILKTEEGQKILYNIVSLIVGNPEGAALAQQMVQPVPQRSKAASSPIVPSEGQENHEEDTKEGKDQSNEALSKLLKLGKMTNLRG
ncbi:hypothetical protein QUF94_27980 [Peribacillus sp. NJ4]|uniref:hypothetical protein n=1 Tax=Peribacillus TaxID=2675229 RepID=UPI0025A0F754|nr:MULTISPECIES: hypothetical protein [unclassified Peribacillus]MDM5215152.1 hypothetical protein [Peribacillus sp. NJ4]MDM5224440.1 hypothetical protein [Peribacillus sp. NJ11]